jgi:formylglycine-generating enzyme required for sulfatase activity
MPTPSIRASVWDGLADEPDYLLWLPGPKRNRLAMRFRRIPAGSFLMGSRGEGSDEEPRHRVVIGQEFWLGKFVVTQAEYRAVVRGLKALKRHLDPEPSDFKGDRRPVEQVSWDDVTAWCDALGQWDGLPADIREVRLPTEAEWEYACRAGTETEYYNGDGEAALAEVGWFDGNSGEETHPVDEPILGRPERHPAGLMGMHGNVWEWCQDVWDANAYRKHEDPFPGQVWTPEDARDDAEYWSDEDREKGNRYRVLRGGSWVNTAGRCRSAFRDRWRPDVRDWLQGFRVCLVRGPASQHSQANTAEAAAGPGGGGRGTSPKSDGSGAAGADPRHESFTGEASRENFLKAHPQPGSTGT